MFTLLNADRRTATRLARAKRRERESVSARDPPSPRNSAAGGSRLLRPPLRLSPYQPWPETSPPQRARRQQFLLTVRSPPDRRRVASAVRRPPLRPSASGI